MAFSTITKGMPNWFSTINQNTDWSKETEGEWLTTGASSVNGFDMQSLRYRTVTFGDLQVVQVDGVGTGRDVDDGSTTKVAQFPANLLPDNNICVINNYKQNGGQGAIYVSYHGDGGVYVTNYGKLYAGYKWAISIDVLSKRQ